MPVIRKLIICPWFGPLPEWIADWARNIGRLEQFGYDVLVTTDLEAFKQRVDRILGIRCPIVPGEGKIHDFRCAFGRLFAPELQDYDYWGHTDFDCVYGRVEHFLPDAELGKLEQFSNHETYVSGPWSLYRNTPMVNDLFMEVPDWWHIMEDPNTTGWVEKSYSDAVRSAHDRGAMRTLWTSWQTRNLDDFSTVHFEGEKLMEENREIMVAHFRRTKVYPERCR